MLHLIPSNPVSKDRTGNDLTPLVNSAPNEAAPVERIEEGMQSGRGRVSKTLKIIFLVLLTLLPIAGLAAAVWVAFDVGHLLTVPTDSDAGATPSPDAERTAVHALARLQPDGGVIGIGVPAGDSLQTTLVKEGEEVEQDHILAHLRSHAMRLVERDAARAQLEEAKQRLAALTKNGQARIEEAVIHLRQIEDLLPLEIRAQEKKVALLTNQRDIQLRLLKRTRAKPAEIVTQEDIDVRELGLLQARAELESASAVLEQLRASRKLSLEAAEAQVRTARKTLERARTEIPLRSLEQAIRVAEEHVRAACLRAPVKGQILRIAGRPGQPAGSRPVLEMADTRHMVAVAEVYETDLESVRIGQKAVLTSRALCGCELHGVVQRIGRIIGRNKVFDLNPTAEADRRVAEVTIELEPNELAARRIHLQVHAAIFVEPTRMASRER